MPTVENLINQSFNDLGVTKAGETVSNTVRDAAFVVLQQYWSSLSTEEAMQYLPVHGPFNLTAGVVNYTLGVGGSLNTVARPVRVTGWTSYSGNFRNGGKPISFAELHALAHNPTAKRSILVEALACDNAFPNLNVEVFPPPDNGPGTLILDYWTPLTPFVSVTDVLSLPDGYEAMLHFGLAIQLAPQYSRVGGVPDSLAADAANSKKDIMDKNAAILGLQQAQPPQQQQPQ